MADPAPPLFRSTSHDDAEFVNLVSQNLSMEEAARQDLLERNDLLSRARALLARLAGR